MQLTRHSFTKAESYIGQIGHMRHFTTTHTRHMSQVEVRLLIARLISRLIVQQVGNVLICFLAESCIRGLMPLSCLYSKYKAEIWQRKGKIMLHVIKNHNDIWRNHASAKICFCK